MITNDKLLKKIQALEKRIKKLEAEIFPDVEKPDEDDILLSQAIAASKPMSKISCSYLQRKLSIGYARLARIMNELEKLGIVHSAKEGGQLRGVVKYSK